MSAHAIAPIEKKSGRPGILGPAKNARGGRQACGSAAHGGLDRGSMTSIRPAAPVEEPESIERHVNEMDVSHPHVVLRNTK